MPRIASLLGPRREVLGERYSPSSQRASTSQIRDPKFLIGLRLTESNLRFRNFGFEMGFCPISQFPLLITQLCCCPLRGRECILLLLCFFRSFCVLHASSTEGILQPIIRLMTGVFPERPRDLLYRYFSRPGLGPHPRIFHRELVKNRVLIGAREPFNHVQVL